MVKAVLLALVVIQIALGLSRLGHVQGESGAAPLEVGTSGRFGIGPAQEAPAPEPSPTAAPEPPAPPAAPPPAASQPAPPPPAATFDFTCPIGAGTNHRRCTLRSLGGFAGPVTISCRGNHPAIEGCWAAPNPVVMRAGRKETVDVGFHYAPPGSYRWEIIAEGGGVRKTFDADLDIVLVPTFELVCPSENLRVPRGGSASHTCRIVPHYGFGEQITLSCPDAPRGISCTFTPPYPAPQGDGEVPVTVRVEASPDADLGFHSLRIAARSATFTSSGAGVALQVEEPR